MKSTRIAPGVAALFLLACGPSYWKGQLDLTGKLQEESKADQDKATDELVKFGHMICNGYSVRVGTKIQAILDANVEVARGTEGAPKKVSLAEAAVDLVRPFMDDYCALARRAAVKLGTPAPAVSSPGIPDTSRPVVAPPSLPAVSAPTGGAAGPAPAGPLPAVSSPVAPPVGVPSPSVPVVP